MVARFRARECPGKCQGSVAFCDWGSSVYTKVRKFCDKRIIDEFEWMARNKIEYVYSADANAGIHERDVDLIRKFVEINQRTGYPKKFRASYAKNSSERVFQITKMLNDIGANKGATLSFQSLDENTLNIVKRKNIKLDSFRDLMVRYSRENIATYSELIVGLPGETYETFADGLSTLVDAGPGNSINVYCCGVFPNSEMADSDYRERHGIKTVVSPVTIYHGTPDADDKHQEHDVLVVSTKTLPPADWLRCWQIAWAVQAFHCMGITQAIAVWCCKNRNVSYRQFYEGLLGYCQTPGMAGTLLGDAVAEAMNLYRNLAAGKPWGIVDRRFGNVLWPVEEGSWLKIMAAGSQVWHELKWFLCELLDDQALVDDLVEYQSNLTVDPFRPAGKRRFNVGGNLHEQVQGVYLGQDVVPATGKHEYEVELERGFGGNLEEFGRFAWYSRKGGSYMWKACSKSDGQTKKSRDQ